MYILDLDLPIEEMIKKEDIEKDSLGYGATHNSKGVRFNGKLYILKHPNVRLGGSLPIWITELSCGTDGKETMAQWTERCDVLIKHISDAVNLPGSVLEEFDIQQMAAFVGFISRFLVLR